MFIRDKSAYTQAEDALLKAGALQNAIFNSANFSSIATDARGVIQIFNVGAERMLGHTAAEVVGKITPADLSDPQEVIARAKALSVELGTEIAPGFEALVFKASRGIEDIYELTYFRKDGSRFPAVVSVTALRDAQDAIIGYLLIGTDNTARKQAEDRMRASEGRYRALFDYALDGIVLSDVNNNVVDANPSVCRMLGYTREQLITLNATDIVAPGEITKIEFAASAIRQGSEQTMEWNFIRKGGAVFPVESYSAALPDGNLVSMFRDITDRKTAETRLLELAHFDPLTGIPNRRHYYELLERSLALASRQAQLVSVLFIDLDGFKSVNDTLGHALGDELLRQVSARMIKCLRTTDTIGRLGGDEFALILMDSNPNAATIVANKIIGELRQPFHLDSHEVTVTASIGITVFPDDSTNAASLMQYADTAMYEAKSAGRDAYRFYTAEMNARALQKLSLENALRKAIERHEFVLHYQPTMQIDTGKWTGAEALLRWNRPGHGLVLPAEFIHALEETGLIVTVGAWVIDTACQQIAEWERTGVGSVAVSVNVSGRQFLLGDKTRKEILATRESDSSLPWLDFAQGAEKVLSKHHTTSGLLAFEFTESTLMSEAEKTVDILRKLQSLGIRISIDDFGTGYSSLAYLRRFPIDTLKIDRAFIRDVTTNSQDSAITTAIISMAHRLNLKTIAEGVETSGQLEFLRVHGCDQAQGYFLARPMPASELAELFRAGNYLGANSPAPTPPPPAQALV